MNGFDRQDSMLNVIDSEDVTVNKKLLESKLLDALRRNVTGTSTQELLIDLRQEEEINTFVWKHLTKLYKNTIDSDEECPIWFQDIAIEKILQPDASSTKPLMTSVGNFICRLLPLQFQRRTDLGDRYINSTEDPGNRDIDYSFGTRDLFLWALLSYRLDLAMDIYQSGWSQDDAPSLIGASLTACKILSRLADIIKETAIEKALELDSSSRIYKTMATSITSACFNNNKNKTRQIILHRRPQWGNQSFLVISSFLEGDESESFRIVLDDLWTGTLEFCRYFAIKLILAIFPPLVIVLNLHEESKTSWYDLLAKWRAYYTAPITKLLFNGIFFVFHLLAFSYFLMTDFHYGSDWYATSIWEKFVTLWVFGLAVEEVRQLITALDGNDIFDCLATIWEHFMSCWNSIDWIMVLLYIFGFVVRLTVDEERFYIARALYTLSLVIMYFRFLRFATIWQYLGPKVEMIRLMMIRDLPPFLMIFVVYFISFGIAYHVLLFPNDVLSLNTILSVITVPFWQTFGEIQMEMTEVTPGCTRNISLANSDPDIERCPETQNYALLVTILSGIFLVMSNVLLLNIVIAVFNQTYGSVGQESAKIHRSHQYSLVEEYIARPVMPPPLNMIEVLVLRPFATLAICLYWSCTKGEDFHWRLHFWKLFTLLMAGKEADPKLWKRVSASAVFTKDRFPTFSGGESVPLNYVGGSQQSGRGKLHRMKRQASRRFDHVTPKQIQRIFKRLNDTMSLRKLKDDTDEILKELKSLKAKCG